MSAELQASASARPVSSFSAVPRAMWIAFGAVSVAAAGLGGALVTKSGDPAPVVAAAPADTTAKVAGLEPMASPATASSFQPAAPAQAQAPAQSATVPAPVARAQPQAAPVRSARPAPAPATHAQHVPAPQAVARAPVETETAQPVQTTRAAMCASCGTVQSVQAVQQQAQGSGVGAIAGGVLGGVLGNQVGGGNGRKAMTVLGALGGGLAGNEVEKRVRATTVYDVQVRMEDGSMRAFRQAQPLAVGTHVVAEGSALRVASEGSRGGTGESQGVRVLRTSGPAGI